MLVELTLMNPRKVTIVEVGPRDGLQNEHASISTADKIEFVNRLSAASLPVIEVSAFVSPKWVPQMADAAAVFAGITRRPGTRYTALVPNVAGLDRALQAGVAEVAVFAASTETFSRETSISRSTSRSTNYKEVCARATAAGVRVRGYLSTAFGCPFEGAVAPARVADVAARLLDLGVFEVAVSDTIGIAHPGQVPRVLDAVLARMPVDTDRAAFSRHARHGARQRPHGPALRHRHVRCVGRRAGRLSVRAGRGGQSRHRRSGLHAGWIGNRDGRVAGEAERGVGVHRQPTRPSAAVALRAGSRRCAAVA